ncbi:MAG TPA: HU family DNA-binding protein [Rhizomicrobium sp.]|nr:HU family DNA-binding protein [Rhizomicrobium sp.]
MSKADFIKNVAKKGNITVAEAKRHVELVFGTIEAGLKSAKSNGGTYQIGTLGTFRISRRGARMGRNPKTGESIRIKASRSLRFKPAAQLKEAAGC